MPVFTSQAINVLAFRTLSHAKFFSSFLGDFRGAIAFAEAFHNFPCGFRRTPNFFLNEYCHGEAILG
jgi:hypothetical protein